MNTPIELNTLVAYPAVDSVKHIDDADAVVAVDKDFVVACPEIVEEEVALELVVVVNPALNI